MDDSGTFVKKMIVKFVDRLPMKASSLERELLVNDQSFWRKLKQQLNSMDSAVRIDNPVDGPLRVLEDKLNIPTMWNKNDPLLAGDLDDFAHSDKYGSSIYRLQHFRRYTSAELQEAVAENGARLASLGEAVAYLQVLDTLPVSPARFIAVSDRAADGVCAIFDYDATRKGWKAEFVRRGKEYMFEDEVLIAHQ